MDPEAHAHNQQLLQTYRAVLREYELQAAAMGLQTPAHVKIEIERHRRLIAELEPRVNLAWPRHNLPPRDYEQFVGREKELEEVRRLLLPQTRAYVVTIDGVGGIGKSALALEVAHGYREGYAALPEAERFEAIVWVSAKQEYLKADRVLRQRQPFRTLDDLCAAITRVHDRPAGAAASSEERRAHAERLLSARRTLLILDNLETVDDEDLLLFLRLLPEPTKAIVTTRHRVDVAFPVRLTGMPEADALALIAQEAAASALTLTPDEREQLWRRTGGVPLAIVWSIGLMRLGDPVKSVLRRLSQGQNDIARFCFDGSVTRIREKDAHKLLLALALFEGDVSREGLGQVAGLGDDEVSRDEGLTDLLKLSLVNKEGDRFSLLPLTRGYALSDLAQQPVEEQRLRERWVAYLTALARPYAQPYWVRPDRGQLRGDGAHLVTLANWARQDERLDLLLPIIPGLANYYDLLGQWNETLDIGRLALDYARLIDDRHSIVFIETYALAWILRQLGRVEEAEAYAADALVVARRMDDVAWQCEVLIRYSQVLRYRQAFDRARALCQEALQLADGLQYDVLRAHIQHELGKLARDQERWQDAAEHLGAARDLFGQRQDNPAFNLDLAWSILSNLAFVTQQLGDLDAAGQMYLQALDFARERGGRGNLITFQIRLAVLEEQRGNRKLALDYAREALEWSRQLGMIQEQVQAQELCARLASESRRDSGPRQSP